MMLWVLLAVIAYGVVMTGLFLIVLVANEGVSRENAALRRCWYDLVEKVHGGA